MYYVPTGEGLLAQLNHAFGAWNIASHFNRSLVLLPRFSHHYGDNFTYSICDIFTLNVTNEITCLTGELADKIYKDCRIMGNPGTTISWSTDNNNYRFNNGNLLNNVDYKTVPCVAGLLDNHGFIKHNITWHKPYTSMLQFQPKYIELLSLAKSEIFDFNETRNNNLNTSIDSSIQYNNITQWNDYYVFHWRRGDQIPKRCIKFKNDQSVNCGSAEEFINAVKLEIEHFRKLEKMQKKSNFSNHTLPLVYIATNEEDPDILQHLNQVGFLTPSFLNSTLHKKYGFVMNQLDTFLVDLLLICDAKHYKAFGLSKIEQYAMWCRGMHAVYLTG